MLNSINLILEIQKTIEEEKIPEQEAESFIKEFENKFLNQLKILCYKIFQNNKQKYLTITQLVDKTISDHLMLPSSENIFKPVARNALKNLEKNLSELKDFVDTDEINASNLSHSSGRRIEGTTFERKKSPNLRGFNRRNILQTKIENPVKTISLKRDLNNSFHGNTQTRKISLNSHDVMSIKNQSFVSHRTANENTDSGTKIHRKISMGLDEYKLRTSGYSKVPQQTPYEERPPKESVNTLLRESGYSRIRVNSTGRTVKIVGNNSSSSKNDKIKEQTQKRVITMDNVHQHSPASSVMTTHTKYTTITTGVFPNDNIPQNESLVENQSNSKKVVISPRDQPIKITKNYTTKFEAKENNYTSVPIRINSNDNIKTLYTQPLSIVRNENQLVKTQDDQKGTQQQEEHPLGKALEFSITGADNENPELRMVSVTDCDTPQRNSVKTRKGDFDTPMIDVFLTFI